MSEVVQDTQQEFWRPPVVSAPSEAPAEPAAVQALAEVCTRCGTEFMIGSRFCYACGRRRPELESIAKADARISGQSNNGRISGQTNGKTDAHVGGKSDAAVFAHLWTQAVAKIWTQQVTWGKSIVRRLSWPKIAVPDWLHYLHFHEIKRWIGLPTASLVAFLIGLLCVVGAVGVGFMNAKTYVDWQAIQFYRAEWLLAATASFVAGILLKKPPKSDN